MQGFPKRSWVWLGGATALLIVALVIPLLTAGVSNAQGGLPPQSFADALADLSTRLGTPLTLKSFDNPTSQWAWRGVDFQDSAMECPQAGETVTKTVVIGYQFVFILHNKRYEYRVSYFDPKSLRFCENPTGSIFDLPTNVPAATVAVGTLTEAEATAQSQPPEALNRALTDLNTRLGFTVTLADFDNPRSRWSWLWVEYPNSQLACPKAGEVVDDVVTPGWKITFVYNRATYQYRTNGTDGAVVLCIAPANPPAKLTPAPLATSTASN